MAYGIGSAAVNLLGYVVTEIFGGEGDAGNVAGSSAGVVSDVADEVAGMVIDDALSGSPTDLLARNAGKLGKAGRSVDDLIGGASPGIGVLGAAVDGIELERLIAKLKAAESEYLKALDRYNSAVALAENSPLSISEEELVALKAEISQLESKKQELELKKIELDSLKSQLPTLKKTRDLQKEMYEECLEQYQSDSSKSEQEKACREAMIFEKEKKKQYDDCMAEN
jgi:hypothetical protein